MKQLNSLLLLFDINSSSIASPLSKKAQAPRHLSILSWVMPPDDTHLLKAGFCSGNSPRITAQSSLLSSNPSSKAAGAGHWLCCWQLQPMRLCWQRQRWAGSCSSELLHSSTEASSLARSQSSLSAQNLLGCFRYLPLMHMS